MNGLDLSKLHIDDRPPPPFANSVDGIEDRYMQKLANYARSLPYSIEPHSTMMELLDFFILRLTQCVEAKNFDNGMSQWDTILTYWSWMKYPIPKEKRILLAKVYFHICTTPGMSLQRLGSALEMFRLLTRSINKLSIRDMWLPWKELYTLLNADLFYSRRHFEISQVVVYLGYLTESARRFYHPAAIEDMLSTMLPRMDGKQLDSILATQYSLLSFLPQSHPQSYLPMLFRVWESLNSYMYDERMLAFLAKLSELHVSPELSDPRKIAEIPDDERSEHETRPQWSQPEAKGYARWGGLYSDVGIFSEHEWHLLMCKCLASMEIPLADSGSLTTGPSADNQVGFEVQRLPKPTWRIISLARIIVYSMAPDGIPAPASNAPSPAFTPFQSGMNTPSIETTTLGDYLSAPLSKTLHKTKTYLAGCKALDSLAKLIASTESFFHPSNSGAWTTDLSAFIKYLVYEFNKRWHEELKPDCKTPKNRRLTKDMRRELVKSLRTVALLAIFSQDSSTVANIQSCLKSMSLMEPDLILHPILERAVPSLEALVETERTLAVIKALGAVAPALVSREVYYPGAKNLVPILQLLIPGIDLNDPSKTMCTTAFLTEISQYIKFGDLTLGDEHPPVLMDTELAIPPQTPIFPSLGEAQMLGISDEFPRLSNEEEDNLLKDTTGSFADWVTSFIRRVIQLLENLPEEGADGTSGGTEVQVVDHVASACTQICIHLSEPLYDLVLNLVYDYASTNVRTNAVRAIHQLVESVANADPDKTIAKFLPFCARNIRIELENGAGSVRSTSTSKPLPSDATLYWNLAVLRGTVYNDGRAVVKHRAEFLSLIKLLHDKTLSKRGYSWTGKLLSSMMLTLTHTYPLENKFVNPDEWKSEEFRWNHHRHWGKLYKPEDVIIAWHVPNDEEIDFALQVFKEVVEPTLLLLEDLLKPGVTRDAIWRNNFCRHMSIIRHAFAGVPTLTKEVVSQAEMEAAVSTSDFLNETPEMIVFVPPMEAGFCLTDPKDPRHKYMTQLKARYGEFLHTASTSLRKQGEENTVDAVHALVRGVRTYLVEYGDSRDSYYLNQVNYNNDVNVAQQYADQKVWPRAVFVRRARYYHSVRLHWNSMDRRRGSIEDNLIDDLVEWSMWHYATIRESSQSLLETLCGSFDGVRRRALPKLYKSLEPGTDDDRMKGALWTLNQPSFGRYAIQEPTIAQELLEKLLRCQHNEKPSVQDCAGVVSENCLNNFPEPCYLVQGVSMVALNKASAKLRSVVAGLPNDAEIIEKTRQKRIHRMKAFNDAAHQTTNVIIKIGESESIHWRYAIVAIRCLRTLIRRDVPITPAHVQYLLDRTHDSHPSIRYYAQRGVMKSLRNIKLRTYCPDARALVLRQAHNPLKHSVAIQPSFLLTSNFNAQFKVPIDFEIPASDPILLDKDVGGYVAWADTISLYNVPHRASSTFLPWEEGSQPAIDSVRKIALDPEFWQKLKVHLSEENHELVMTQDNASTIKSIFQLLEDEPFEVIRPTLEALVADKDQDKQRAAAEMIGGLLNGAKHWPIEKQQKLWAWFMPLWKQILTQNLKTDTVNVWASFIEYMFYNKDPRRLQPIVDSLVEAFDAVDFNAELSFDSVKILTLFRSFYEELGTKFNPWAEQVLDRIWPEIYSDHDEVRAFIAEILAFTDCSKCQPKPTLPTVETFVKECRILPLDYDIMGMRGTFHKGRIATLVENFKVWREDRVPGVRAFQSKYDRVGVTICKWFFQTLHDIHAIAAFDYILPLMPELFRFTELNDNDELANRASVLLVRMCGVPPPRSMVNPILEAIFETISSSPSWRVRLKALPLVQVFYFRHVPLISDGKVIEILEALCRCLDDEVVEVREKAASTLSGVLRLSPRRSIMTYKDRFVRLAKNTHIPARQDSGYNKAIRQRHAAILGICALVDSYPYTVEKWMPELLTDVLAEHTYDPIPISTTVRRCASNFRRTHQDTWHEDSKRFNEDQLAALSTLLTGSSYYA